MEHLMQFSLCMLLTQCTQEAEEKLSNTSKQQTALAEGNSVHDLDISTWEVMQRAAAIKC